jgi:hypothetical protein
MTDVWAVLGNNTAIAAYTHTLFGAVAVGGSFLLGISWYHLYHRRKDGIDTVGADGKVIVGESTDLPGRDKTDHAVWIKSLRIGALVGIIAFAGVAITGDVQAKLMFEQQPMKMASAEAACHDGTEFSVLTIADPSSNDCDGVQNVFEIPGLLSFLANGDFSTPGPRSHDPAAGIPGKLRHPHPRRPALRRTCRRGDQLPADHDRHLLGIPDDDRLRSAGRRGLRDRPVAGPQGHSARSRSGSAADSSWRSPRRSSRTRPGGSSPRWDVSPSSSLRTRPSSTVCTCTRRRRSHPR